MDIDPKLIPIAISLLALSVLWLYDGTLFTRERVAQRRFDRAERKRQRHTASEIQDIRDKAHRSL